MISNYLKRFISVICILAVTEVYTCGFVFAEGTQSSGTFGENNSLEWVYNSSDNSLVISGTGAMPDITNTSDIPWEEYRESVRSIEVEDGITYIGARCFQEHTALEEVVISDTVTTMGVYTFNACTELSSVTLSKNLKSIPNGAFNRASALSEVTVPSKTKVTAGSFRYTSSDIEIKVYGGSVAHDCFGADLSMPDVVNVGEDDNHPTGTRTCTLIGTETGAAGDAAWTWDYQTKTLTFSGTGAMTNWHTDNAGDAQTHYNMQGWQGYIDSAEKVVIGSGITEVGDYSFFKYSRLSEVDFLLTNGATSLTRLGKFAFGDTSVVEVEIPHGVVSIDECAFRGKENAPSLTAITIPKTVTSINKNTLYRNTNAVIYCYKETSGMRFAINNGFDYIVLDGEEYEPFTDVSDMSDEAFFGRWDAQNSQWTVRSKINYSYSADLAETENYAKLGQYTKAKEALLDYYRQRASIKRPSIYSGANNTFKTLTMLDMYNFSEPYITEFTVNSSDYTKYDIDLGTSTANGVFMLAAKAKDGDVLSIMSKEGNSSKAPQLVLQYKNGNVVRLTAKADSYTRAYDNNADYSNNAYGSESELCVKDGFYKSGGKYLPISSKTREAYIAFDQSSINKENLSSVHLIIYAKLRPEDGTSTRTESQKEIMVFDAYNKSWKEKASDSGTYPVLTWANIAHNHYSWNGLPGGFDWEAPTDCSSEFLNYNTRFSQLSALLVPYTQTGDSDYLYKSVDMVLDFIKDAGAGMPAERDIEPAQRMLELTPGFFYFTKSALFNSEAASAVLKYIWQEANYLYEAPVYYDYNNRGVWHTTAFLTVAKYFPEFNDSSKWDSKINERLETVVNNIVGDDGCYIEPTFSYANDITLKFFVDILNVCNNVGVDAPSYLRNSAGKLAHYLMSAGYPTGITPDWGEGGRTQTKSSRIYDIGKLVGDEELKYWGSNGREGILPAQTAFCYDKLKVVTSRTDWGSDAYMIFMNAKNGGSHSHRDSLSLDFFAHDREILSDTGMTSYDPKHPHTAWQRNQTKSHNTIEIDGTPQRGDINSLDNSGSSSIALYTSDNTDRINAWTDATEGFRHFRNVSFIKDLKFAVVSDMVQPLTTAGQSHTYTQNWHSRPGSAAAIDSTSLVGSTNFGSGTNVRIIQMNKSNMTASLETGYDSEGQSTTKYFSYKKVQTGKAAYDTILMPVEQGTSASATATAISTNTDASVASAMQISVKTNSGESRNVIYYNSHEYNSSGVPAPTERSFGGYGTDASCVVLTKDTNGNDKTVQISHGKKLTYNGNTIINVNKKLSGISVAFAGNTAEVQLNESETNGAEITFKAPSSVNTVNVNGTGMSFTRSGSNIVVKVSESGTFGKNNSLVWVYDYRDNSLTVSGTGAMPEYDNNAATPWESYKNQITKVVIADGVTRVGVRTFQQYTALTEVIMANTVTSMGSYAFNACSNLTSVTISENLTSIPPGAFNNTAKLKSINVPYATTVDADSFAGTAADVVIGVHWMSAAHTWAAGGEDGTTPPVRNMGSATEASGRAYTTLPLRGTVKDGITWSLADGVLTVSGTGVMPNYGTRNTPWEEYRTLITKAVIDDGITYVGARTFQEYTALAEVIMADSVTETGDYLFNGCTSLTTVMLSENLQSINKGVFNNTGALKTISVPYKTEVNSDSFIKTASDVLIKVCSDSAAQAWAESGEGGKTPAVLNIGSDGSSSGRAYEVVLGDGAVTDTITWAISDGTLIISGTGDMPDYGSKNTPWSAYRTTITGVVIGSGITRIGARTFRDHTALRTAAMANTVTSAGDYLFDGCTSLTSVTLSENLQSISLGTFSNTGALKEITVPYGTQVNAGSFMKTASDLVIKVYCTSAAHTWAADGTDGKTPAVTDVGSGNTSSGRAYTVLPVGGAVTGTITWSYNMGTLTLSGTGDIPGYDSTNVPWDEYKASITKAVVESGITRVGARTFQAHTALEEAVIANTVTSMGNYVFNGCTSLNTVTLSENLGSINNGVFNNTSALKEITVPYNTQVSANSFMKTASDLVIKVYKDSAAHTWAAGGENGKTPEVTDIGSGNTSSGRTYAVIVGSGTVTDTITWSITDTTLTISGTGEIPNYGSGVVPWEEYKALITKAVIGKGITRVGSRAFQAHTALQEVVMADTVTEIGDYLFNSCSSLNSVTLSKNLKSITGGAFNRASALRELTVPSKTKITADSFRYTNADIIINVYGGTPAHATFGDDLTLPGVLNVGDPNGSPTGSRICAVIDTETAADGDVEWTWDYTTKTLTFGGTGAMTNWHTNNNGDPTLHYNMQGWQGYIDSAENVVIGSGITEVGDYSFFKYSKLKNVDFELDNGASALIRVGKYAFGDTSVKELYLPQGTEAIDDCAFRGKETSPSMRKLYIPASAANIKNNILDRNTNAVVYCHSGSAGMSFAVNNGFGYRLVDTDYFIFSFDADAGNAVILNNTDSEKAASVILASYANGALGSVSAAAETLEPGINKVDIGGSAVSGQFKIMLWDSFADMTPLAETYTN